MMMGVLVTGGVCFIIFFLISVSAKKVGRKILVGWIIVSWLFIIICGLIPVETVYGDNIMSILAGKIGMPTSFTWDELYTFPVWHQVIFSIGGLMFLTCPSSGVTGLLFLLSGGQEGAKELFNMKEVVK